MVNAVEKSLKRFGQAAGTPAPGACVQKAEKLN